METLLLNQQEVSELLNMPDAIKAVEEAYKAYNLNKVQQPPIVSIDVAEHKGEIDIKACYSGISGMTSVKTAVGYWNNPEAYGLPTLLATICLFDGKTGYPVCIMDGRLITEYRTGAAGAVSAKVLARKDSKTVGVIGAGSQARMQLRALAEVLTIETVKVWSRSKEKLAGYKSDIEALLGINVVICDVPEESVAEADIVVTATPGKKAIILKDWIEKGTHIIAVGADMEGKQEIDPEIFSGAKIVVDSIDQCTLKGETQNPIKAGIISAKDIHAEIGEVLLGKKPGRVNDDEITIFDTTGMGVQDNTTAKIIYDWAVEKGLGQYLRLI